MDPGLFQALLTPAGQSTLQAAAALEPVEPNFLRDFGRLQQHFPPDLARAALEIAILRRTAAAKFPQAEQMYFTRPALEQASSYTIAAYRAQRYAGLSQVIDLGCSVGGDSLALAQQAPTLGIDLDPLRLAMAQANAKALGLEHQAAFVRADLGSGLPLQLAPTCGLFFDPARRANGRRIFSVRQYQPPLDIVHTWLDQTTALGVKISPGVDLAELAEYEAEVEFISLSGELKEAVLWFGPLRSSGPSGAPRSRATLLPGGHSLSADRQVWGREPQTAHHLSQPGAYLYEPDPSVLRAGLVQTLGEQIGAAQLDPDIAYLTSNQDVVTPFARRWAIESWMPFQLKRLRAALRQQGVGRVIVKKRGSPIEPEQLIRELRLKDGAEERVLFLTHLQGEPVVLIGYPPASSG